MNCTDCKHKYVDDEDEPCNTCCHDTTCYTRWERLDEKPAINKDQIILVLEWLLKTNHLCNLYFNDENGNPHMDSFAEHIEKDLTKE